MKSLKIQLPVNKCIKSSSVIIHTQRTISQSQKKLSYQKKKKKPSTTKILHGTTVSHPECF